MKESKQTEILIETSSEQIKDFVEDLYKNGEHPYEKFGITTEQLEKLDRAWFMKGLNETTQRRIELGKRMNAQKLCCPECKTRQVQLVGYINIKPAEWRCRHCKHEFTWEGE